MGLVLVPITFVLLFLTGASSEKILNCRDAVGSPVAGNELYGIGIRIGLYLQSLGMLLACARLTQKSGAGFKLASAANMIAILAALTRLLSLKALSPCEAWLVLLLVSLLPFRHSQL